MSVKFVCLFSVLLVAGSIVVSCGSTRLTMATSVHDVRVYCVTDSTVYGDSVLHEFNDYVFSVKVDKMYSIDSSEINVDRFDNYVVINTLKECDLSWISVLDSVANIDIVSYMSLSYRSKDIAVSECDYFGTPYIFKNDYLQIDSTLSSIKLILDRGILKIVFLGSPISTYDGTKLMLYPGFKSVLSFREGVYLGRELFVYNGKRLARHPDDL